MIVIYKANGYIKSQQFLIMIEQINKKLRQAKRVLILTHHNADIDAAGSLLGLQTGLKQLGIDADAGVSESISRSAHLLCEEHKILIDPDCFDYDLVILVDTAVKEQLRGVKNLRADIILDHHLAGELAEGAVCIIEPDTRSTAQIVFKLLLALGCKIDKKIARFLAAGIVADTAHLKLADIDSLEVLLSLLRTGVKLADVLKLISREVDVSEAIACLKAAQRTKVYRIGDITLAVSAIASHEAAACRALIRAGADIAVVGAKKEKELRISSRAKDKILGFNIDLAEIFKEVGKIIAGAGGGHNLAGSANGKNKEAFQQAINFIIKEIEKKIKKRAKKL